MSQEHKITMYYIIYDDGIWLECSCGWRHCLGFDPTPEQAKEEADRHRRGEE